MPDAITLLEDDHRTVAHPHSPDEPPLDILGGLLAAAIDRVRDALSRARDVVS